MDLSAHNLVSQILNEVVSIGGTITSEHGVGDAKAEFIGLELSPHEIEIMKNIKKMFDPKGIMNPGQDFCLGMESFRKKGRLQNWSPLEREEDNKWQRNIIRLDIYQDETIYFITARTKGRKNIFNTQKNVVYSLMFLKGV